MSSKAWQIAVEVVKAEEQARQSKPELKPEVKVKPKTTIYSNFDKTVKDRHVLADVTGSGKLVKLRIVSPSSSFKILLKIDGETQIDNSYTELTEMLAAYEEDDLYYLHLEEKSFRERLVIIVSVTEETTFTLLFAEVLLEN